VNWGPSGTTQNVNVRCFTPAGALADSTFTASFLRAVANLGPIGYVWADQISAASYSPSSTYSFNSAGGANTITRSAVGAYQVHLPGLGQSNGNVKVTAYGSGSELCKVSSWGPSGTTQLVNVRCFTTGGAPVDTRFTMTYARNSGVIGIPGTQTGYAWANSPTSASYTPSAAYSFNSSGGANTITRSSTGDYTVRMAGLASPVGGNVQVSGYGANTTECKVGSWFSSGSDLLVSVRCFTTGGVPADAYYTVTYTR